MFGSFSHGLTQMDTDDLIEKQERRNPSSLFPHFLIQKILRCSVRCPQRIGLCVAVLVSSTDAGVWHKRLYIRDIRAIL
jgi:hypothetical protein